MKEKNKTLDFYTRRVWFSTQKYYNILSKEKGATVSESSAIINVSVEGVLSGDLARNFGVEVGSLSRTLASLEKKGLIMRKKNGKDLRNVLICLTKEGIEMREYAKKTILELNEKIETKLGESELNELIGALKNVNRCIDEFTTELKRNKRRKQPSN